MLPYFKQSFCSVLLCIASHPPPKKKREHKTKVSLCSFCLPDGKSDVYGVWALVDKIIQQVILQQKNGKDPDGAPLEEINLKQIVMQ